MIRNKALWGILGLAAIAAGCTSLPRDGRGPVMGYGAGAKPAAAATAKTPVMDSSYETVTRIYFVQQGDTLYSISFQHGVDYRDVAEWNNIADPSAIQVGQQLQLHVPVGGPVMRPGPAPVMDSHAPEAGGVKNYPRVGKLAYSDQALARAEQLQYGQKAPAAVAPVRPLTPREIEANSEPSLEWGMPTSGKVIAGYSESDNRKGVDIAGQKGQAVVASASGKVVYSGSGLRGYGKLIIIKHNQTYLSAYAHNDQILVKEGQTVSKGQKIAEMGNSDADQVKLHFEIRKMGKPVDPAKYLPPLKS